jgi:hypothetical protein
LSIELVARRRFRAASGEKQEVRAAVAVEIVDRTSGPESLVERVFLGRPAIVCEIHAHSIRDFFEPDGSVGALILNRRRWSRDFGATTDEYRHEPDERDPNKAVRDHVGTCGGIGE